LVLSDFVVDEAPAGVVLALHRATHATLQVLATRLAGLDLPASEINVLANLAVHHPLTVGALAATTATRPTTLTSVLDRLVRRGYVAREVDPADRRSFLISLTPAGQPAAAAVSAAVHDLERGALARVNEAERAGFFAVIRALSEVSSDPEPRPAPAPPAPGPGVPW
jgi:DNA-binding MarR family transcriptional regulator